MANTAHKTDDEIRERFEDEFPERLIPKAKQLAQLIRESKHCVLFTGAGVSTSCGVPDFRGPKGVWTLKAKGQRPSASVDMLQAIPSLCHMACVALVNAGLCKFVISQNVDGLHRRSGLALDVMAEVHGNTNEEKCAKCGKRYMRDFSTRRRGLGVYEHQTGRFCDNPSCKGELQDSIINFGENLPERELRLGFKHGEKADLHIVLGSSLRVTPAADMPARTVQSGGRLVIVNLQTTPLDKSASMVVHARTDVLLAAVLKELDIPIPDWRLNRRLIFRPVYDSTKSKVCLNFQCVDESGSPYSFLRKLEVMKNEERIGMQDFEPFNISISEKKLLENSDKNPDVMLVFSFFGNYNEPPLAMKMKIRRLLDDCKIASNGDGVAFLFSFSPKADKWEIGKKGLKNGDKESDLVDLIKNLKI